jgi:hypothetical protein
MDFYGRIRFKVCEKVSWLITGRSALVVALPFIPGEPVAFVCCYTVAEHFLDGTSRLGGLKEDSIDFQQASM